MTAPPARHPMEPLTAEEITAATGLLRADPRLPTEALFARVELDEPTKAELAAARPDAPADRRVAYSAYDRASRTAYEAVVSLSRQEVSAVTPIPGVQPALLLFSELYAAGELVRADPRWQAAARARGVTDPATLQLDPWAVGVAERPGRLARVVGYFRHTPEDNGYAHPLDGLVATVDLDEMAVVEVTDTGAVPIPTRCDRYDTPDPDSGRPPLRPLEITQSEGPSFTLSGNAVRWDRWAFVVSLHPTEGLVLHDVSFAGRSVLHRAGLSEMVVPYAGTSVTSWWKNAFDAGEMSLGRLVNSLELGCDCLGEIVYLDAVFADERGLPYQVPRAICLHEEDFGLLWKHTDLHTGRVQVRRSRRLVASIVATVGNYEYRFAWHFYLDGRIEFEVRLTGIVQTEAAAAGGGHTRPVSPELVAPHHQHLFNVRLDMAVDGPRNCVYEVDAVAVDSPHGNGWESHERLLASEAEGVRDTCAATGRYWKVVNRQVRNAVGAPVGYALVPASVPLMLAHPDSVVAQRAGFARHALWVTAGDERQRHAAGEYPNQATGEGLPAWVRADRPLVDADVVLWHTFGSTHVVRPEDWPVMPVESCGFTLRPLGFFDANPALDVAPSPGHCG